MNVIAKVSAAMQTLFTTIATAAGATAQVIRRRRAFSAETLAQTFILGHLHHPNATIEQLAQTAAACGVTVTLQAVHQRFTAATAAFLKDIFQQATQLKVGADRALAPILERFTCVDILDSTTLALPAELQDEYAGCGGGKGGGQAALKLQTELDLRSGSLACVEIEAGKCPDAASARQFASRGPGSLRIADLGYFSTPTFARMDALGEYFLSRLAFGTKVAFTADGAAVDPLTWLTRQQATLVEGTVWLSKGQRLRCRLFAWRVPADVAAKRRQRLREAILDERGCAPSAARLAWCDWTVLVTNVPEALLTATEALVLYRARWQVELLFKRWKSADLVAVLQGTTVARQMVRVWARLTAAVLQHWLLLASVWGDPTKSLDKASRLLRDFVGQLIAALRGVGSLEQTLLDMARLMAKTCRRTKRKKKPGTFELLNDVSRLEFRLT